MIKAEMKSEVAQAQEKESKETVAKSMMEALNKTAKSLKRLEAVR